MAYKFAILAPKVLQFRIVHLITFGAKIALHHVGVHTEKAAVWCYLAPRNLFNGNG